VKYRSGPYVEPKAIGVRNRLSASCVLGMMCADRASLAEGPACRGGNRNDGVCESRDRKRGTEERNGNGMVCGYRLAGVASRNMDQDGPQPSPPYHSYLLWRHGRDRRPEKRTRGVLSLSLASVVGEGVGNAGRLFRMEPEELQGLGYAAEHAGWYWKLCVFGRINQLVVISRLLIWSRGD